MYERDYSRRMLYILLVPYLLRFTKQEVKVMKETPKHKQKKTRKGGGMKELRELLQ